MFLHLGSKKKTKEHELETTLFLAGRAILSTERRNLSHGREAPEPWEGDILG